MKNKADLYLKAATIDEILSDDFQSQVGQKANSDVAALRLAAWCRACASGDWLLFNSRLERDHITFEFVLSRFSNAKVKENIKFPPWVNDAEWIQERMCQTRIESDSYHTEVEDKKRPFEDIFVTVISHADYLVWHDISQDSVSLFNCCAKRDLRSLLMQQLTALCAPVFYKLFIEFKKTFINQAKLSVPDDKTECKIYNRFVEMMRSDGVVRVFADKPVLLRLVASHVRQWITVTKEFVERYAKDQIIINKEFLFGVKHLTVSKIRGELSDLHNSGHSVLIIEIYDGLKLVYKPKDCRLDAAWYQLVHKLNGNKAPIQLRPSKVIPLIGYGWAEYVGNPTPNDLKSVKKFFERSGAWLALFHVFIGSDMHHENIIAEGEHPIPIDLEMILQSDSNSNMADNDHYAASEIAATKTLESVLTVGMLPTFVRTTENEIVGMGGLDQNRSIVVERGYQYTNTDAMIPIKANRTRSSEKATNLPYYDEQTAQLTDYIDDFLNGFKSYASYLIDLRERNGVVWMFDGFTGLKSRKVIRPTRFYHALITRLQNSNNMQDGIIWSADLDFVSRFSDWDQKEDPQWPIIQYERLSLSELNIPVFLNSVDGNQMSNPQGLDLSIHSIPGLEKAVTRLKNFSLSEVNWQTEVIRTSIITVSSYTENSSYEFDLASLSPSTPDRNYFLNEAQTIAATLNAAAVKSSTSAAWIGLDWLGDSDTSQLTPLGSDLYNGVSGIALFLAAYGMETGDDTSLELSMAGIARLRHDLKGTNAQRVARLCGVGGGSGLGSIVYAFSVISELIKSNAILDDAMAAATLISKELIEADEQLDVMGGSAGAILGLLRLYRQSNQSWILGRATECGEYLLRNPRLGVVGMRSWAKAGVSSQPLNGMSHGAAGFAYALSALATATGRSDFATAANECVEYENSSFDLHTMNWPDYRRGIPHKNIGKICQWCHGAIGIGLSRLGLMHHSYFSRDLIANDVHRALEGAKLSGRKYQDSLCCGELGRIEFLNEAGKRTGNLDLAEYATNELAWVIRRAHHTGGYNFGGGAQNFHLSLFRGLAGVGYTALRQVNPKLPNILIWE